MSTSIRQKITLFTLVPAVLFYSVVTAVFLYFSFRAASSEISRRHLEQSLHYAAVIDGNIREVEVAGKSLALDLEHRIEKDDFNLEASLSFLFASSSMVVGGGLIDVTASGAGGYWEKNYAGAEKTTPLADIPGEEVLRAADSDISEPYWYTSPSPEDLSLFRSSLLLPVRRASGVSILRLDIDGARLIEPLQWRDMNTRLLLLDRKGVAVYASGISFPKLRAVDKFIKSGPCEAYSNVQVTGGGSSDVTGFIISSVKPSALEEPCGVYREAMQRVVEFGQSINFRIQSRGIKRWVTATPIASTGWYFSISILEKDILGPVINQAILSASLIALALVFTLFCLWAVSGRITRPLNRLKQRMNEYAMPFEVATEGDVGDEASSLGRSFSRLLDRLSDRERALHQVRANNIGHLVQQLRGRYFYFNLNPDGVITHVSPSLTAVLGYPADQFTGRMQDYLTPSGINREFSAKLQGLISGHWEEAFEVEMRHHHDGVRRIELFCTVSSHSPATGNAIEGMGNDITHRINDTEKFKLLIAASPDAIVVTNQDGIILMVNRRVLKLFRYEEDELLNMPLAMLIDMKAREQQPLLKPYDFHNPERHCLDSFLSEGLDQEGRCFPMEVSSNVLHTSEGIQISIVLRDITERKKIEKELVRAKVHAEHASRAKSMFLSNISHELRTPLNGVLGYAQLLLSDKEVPERYQESLKSLEECGLHLMTLINDILDITKIESSGVSIDPQPFDLQATLRTVLSSVREAARSKQLELILTIEDGIAAEVIGDNVKLRQVLINLVGNAVKFTQKGAVEVIVTTDKQQSLCFAVADTGIGISVQEQENLFKPFSQLKAGQKQGGTGLGLAISYRLVKAMGGELVIESTPGKGSRFSFAIPYLKPEGACDVEQDSSTPEPDLAVHLNGKRRILVVDDSTNNRDILVSALSSHGFAVDSAEDGLAAVEQCRNQHYDLVLMDLKMPRMDGLTASRTIRQLSGLGSMKIIAVSASVSDRTRCEIGKSGISDFIGKPVRFKELFNKVYRCLGSADGAEGESITFAEDPGIRSVSALTMVRAMEECLEIGDIESLRKQAVSWRNDRDFGRYPARLARLCSNLDMQSIESMKEELTSIGEKTKQS